MDATTLASAGMGAAVGIVLALSGAGGGILAVPLLVFGLGMSLAQAAPVGLIAIGLASALGAALALRDGSVRYRAALIVGAVGMACAPFGVWLARQLPNAPLMFGFSAVLAWVAWRNLHQPAGAATFSSTVPAMQVCRLDPSCGRLVLALPCVVALACTGALSGLLSGLLGVGGGFVIVPMMHAISNVPTKGIAATSLAVLAFVSIGGVGGAASQGAVEWGVALPFATGAVIALLAARPLGARLDARRLRQIFGGTAAVVAILILLRGLGIIHA